MFDNMVDRISASLREKMGRSGNYQFDIVMKSTGNKLHISRRFSSPYKSCGHWHSGSAIVVVTGDGIDGEKIFKNFETMAKAIVAGYVR